jgi:hypothetical protein
MTVTLARGAGIAGGGIIRDFGLQLSGNANIAYALVFGSAAIGLAVAAWCLNRIHADAFKQIVADEVDTAAILVGSMD